jgi:hypothetical protein
VKYRHASQSLVAELIERFKMLDQGSPPWAWPFHPSIPFVGQRFRPGRSILVYASAENFTWLNGKPTPKRFTTDAAWNRYRVRYEEAGRSSGDFFPDVGIQPATDGGLLAAALFVSERLGLPLAKRPRTFLEYMAVTNWAKFTIRSRGQNRDYIDHYGKLTCSLPFVITELSVLQPAAVLIPRVVWRHPMLAAAMRGASPRTRFLPLPQFNATVVNCHLLRHNAAAHSLRRHHRGQSLDLWMSHLAWIRPEHAWRFIAVLAVASDPHAPVRRTL